jgi:hypothetical protein
LRKKLQNHEFKPMLARGRALFASTLSHRAEKNVMFLGLF